MEPSWFTITGCPVNVRHRHLCGDRIWLTCCISPTGPAPMHIGRPNATGIRGPGPIRRQINRFRCLKMLSNVRRRTSLRFAKLLGLSPRSCQTRHHRMAPWQSSPRKSTMRRRCHRCVQLRSVGGDRSRLCRCHYRVSPRRVSHRISGSRLRLRLRSTHHHLCPGHEPLAWILLSLTSVRNR